MIKVVVATSNKGKLREIEMILEGYDVLPYTQFLQPMEIVEDGQDFKDNAIIKAKAIYDALNDIEALVIADDSGISVPVLNNEPGIYSARYAGENATDKDNLNKLVAELKTNNIMHTEAYYTSAIALACSQGIFTTHGWMHGKVIDSPRGENGFGYDPMFIPANYEKTLGELDDSVKKRISHRSQSLYLASLLIHSLIPLH